MSFPQHGMGMDQPSGDAGSIARARERTMADFSRPQITVRQMSSSDEEDEEDDNPSFRQRGQTGGKGAAPSRIPRLRAQPGLQRDGQGAITISRPTQIPQWPFRGPSPSNSTPSDYEPPPGKSQPPQRPPRPSQVPSFLDASQIQDPVPGVFLLQQQQQQSQGGSSNDLLSIPSAHETSSRPPSTLSSIGSIPDFPVPAAAAPARRSVNLGPPPSARRGASSFYSNASYVSPIPEESPRSRSHVSYASSAAMPDGWTTDSPGYSPGEVEAFYDQRVRDSSRYSDSEFEDDESELVRSASVGKRGIPALVMTPSQQKGTPLQRPYPSPIQPDTAFATGTAYIDASTSSSGALPTTRGQAGSGLTADNMLGAYEGASGSDPAAAIKMASSPRMFSRLSAIRRPPRLDVEAVRDAEARGSLTSLPDLIRRATRLAAMIEKGRRPTSRFGLDDYPQDMYGQEWDPEKDPSINEKHQSGLSDMLAAFPPPAQAVTTNRRTFRQSLRQSASTAWPLPFVRSRNGSQDTVPRDNYNLSADSINVVRNVGNDGPLDSSKRERDTRGPRRRCCGLPKWGFALVILIILILIAAAVIIPLQFFVFQDQDNGDAQPALAECQAQLICENGGTNVVSRGICSCICTNGFTGSNCNIPGSEGCTTVTINSTDATNISNVTLGQAIPRLIESAQTNFSIPLSATAILAKLNTQSLSCASQNALVTFNGQSIRGSNNIEVGRDAITFSEEDSNGFVVVNQLVTLTIEPGVSSTSTITVTAAATGMSFSTIITAPIRSTVYATTITLSTIINPRTSVATPTTPGSAVPTFVAPPSSRFTVSDNAMDFARVAVLFILQEETLDDASRAQNNLQRFLSIAGSTRRNGGATIGQATNITVGADNSVDLVNFRVDVGNGLIEGSLLQ